MLKKYIFPHLTKELVETMVISRPEARQLIRERLRHLSRQPERFTWSSREERAAVLVPLLIDSKTGQSSLLYTVRSAGLKNHGGEVSFPGGKYDHDQDRGSLETCALRETWEEIGVSADRIEILGSMFDVPSKDRRLRITPFVGIINGHNDVYKLNPGEVEDLFHLSLGDLVDASKVQQTEYRRKELLAIIPSFMAHPKYRVWGLTGYITNALLEKILFPPL